MSISRLQAGPRVIALEIAAEARAEWGFATDIIARAFRAHRELASGARRLIAETVYGLIRMDRRLDAIIEELTRRSAGREAPLAPLVRDELKLLVYEARAGVPVDALAADVKRLVREPIDLARACADDAGLEGRTGVDREATRLSYPTWLLEAWVEDYGAADATALAEAMNQRAPLAVRVNTARIGRDTLIAQLAEEHVVARATPLSPVGLVFETRVNAFGLSAFRDGLFEVMDEDSQLVAELVAPPPGGRVLDACAGAGGKTLALGALLGGKGRVLALDTDGKKLEELRRRARRAGLTNVQAKQVGAGTGDVAKAAPGTH
jgi:16S rRNA (cytosine967-C5)-methyltransferase